MELSFYDLKRIEIHKKQIINHEKMIEDIIKRRKTNGIMEDILADVSLEYRVGEEEILSKSRKKEIVIARREFCKRAKEKNYTYARIANFIGMHHTSIIYLVNS